MTVRRVLGGLAAAVLAAGGLTLALAPAAQAGGGNVYYVSTAPTARDTNNCTSPTTACATVQHALSLTNLEGGDTVHILAGTYAQAFFIDHAVTVTGDGTSGTNDTKIDCSNADLCNGCTTSITVQPPDGGGSFTAAVENLDVSGNPGCDGIDVAGEGLNLSNSVVSGNGGYGVDVEGSSTVAITGTTISDNHEDGVAVGINGGQGSGASVSITGSTVDGNGSGSETNGPTGGIVANSASLVKVTSTTVSGNPRGGVFLGGVITAKIDRSTVAANGGFGLGLIEDQGVDVVDSTVSGNTLTKQPTLPAAFATVGTGVFDFASRLTLDTSTVADNGGYGMFDFLGQATVTNSTISGTTDVPNLSPAAGAVVIGLSFLPEAVRPQVRENFGITLSGTVVAQNAVPDCSADPELGVLVDGGYNLDDDATCGLSETNHSISKGAAKLGALANNGGPTQTLLPAKGSQLIDAIPASTGSGTDSCSASNTDQRGLPRLAGPACDIGAVEVAQPPVLITPTSLPGGTVGVAYPSTQLTASGGLGAPYVFSVAPGSSMPPGLSLSSTGVVSGTPTQAGTFDVTISVDDPTLKLYVVAIAAPPLAATGVEAATTVSWGVGLLGAGALLLTAGAVRRRPRRNG